MIKVDPLYVHTADYTVCIDGNGGEEQLVVIATSRQDGRTSYHIESVSVDGKCETMAHGLDTRDEFGMVLSKTLARWCAGGIPVSTKEASKHLEMQLRVLKKLHDHYQLGE